MSKDDIEYVINGGVGFTPATKISMAERFQFTEMSTSTSIITIEQFLNALAISEDHEVRAISLKGDIQVIASATGTVSPQSFYELWLAIGTFSSLLYSDASNAYSLPTLLANTGELAFSQRLARCKLTSIGSDSTQTYAVYTGSFGYTFPNVPGVFRSDQELNEVESRSYLFGYMFDPYTASKTVDFQTIGTLEYSTSKRRSNLSMIK
jgi:hypothetical protein